MTCPFEIESSWYQQLKGEWDKGYLIELAAFLEKERATNIPVYPPRELVFNAFQMTPFSQVKVVIIGQDPYHGPGQAHGLSFSVPKGIPAPPSLKNIFKELQSDIGFKIPDHGCLLSWARQGVLLLNTLLTVRQSEPMSHQKRGWEVFTDAVVAKLSQRKDPVIFLLWGRAAQEKCQLPKNSSHKVFTAAHPSPLSVRNFSGCRHFSQANEFLIQQGKTPIQWQLT